MPRRPNRDRYYQRGDFWLDHLSGKGEGSPFYIFWYDDSAQRIQRRSTGQGDIRLAKDTLDEHYRAVHQPTTDEKAVYTVHDAMVDYWQEHGSKQTSEQAIRARLKLVRRFLDAEIAAGRLREPVLPSRLDDVLMNRFREWATKSDGIVTRSRNAETGEWVETTRVRAASTVEESIIQLKAALNHNARRMAEVPRLKHKTRNEVTPKRKYLLSLDQMAEMLDYTATGGDGRTAAHVVRLVPLRRYLIGGICTLARPDAIMDMSVLRERSQWQHNLRTFDLNPEGRIQTRKYRATLPVVDLLDAWLRETDDRLVCQESVRTDEDGEWILQTPVVSVKKAWTAMRPIFGIPGGYGTKLLRSSVSSLLRQRRVDKDELAVAMGHEPIDSTTAIYAKLDPLDPEYLATVRQALEDLTAEIAKKAGMPIRANSTQVGADGRRRRSPGQ